MPGKITYNKEARTKIQSGVDQLANTVKTTLGPKGRYVVIEKPDGPPLVTNDGATIAGEIELEDPLENRGVQILKEVASKTNTTAGDGTTTAIVLAQRIIREGFRLVASGANPLELRKGIQGATQLAVSAIKRLSQPVETREVLAQVATASAKDPGIGEIIAEALTRVGTDGAITVEEHGGMRTELKVLEGMRFEKGYLSPRMLIDAEKENRVARLDNPLILITDRTISDPQDIIPLLDRIVEQNRSLLIVAEGVEGGALGMLVMNRINGTLNAVAIHPPAYGEGRRARMDDLAIWTGGTFITEDRGYTLREATPALLGSAASVTVGRQSTVIVDGAGDKEAIEIRIAYLKAMIEAATYDFDREQLEERLAKLVSGVAIVKVGAATDTEMREKKSRATDALNAARAAQAEGIVPGGGIVFLNIIAAIKSYRETLTGDIRAGATIIMNALKEPARQIAENAGREGNTVIAEVVQHPRGVGLNVATGEYTNMMEAGIVDCAKVCRLALQNAASAAAVLLTTEAAVGSAAEAVAASVHKTTVTGTRKFVRGGALK